MVSIIDDSNSFRYRHTVKWFLVNDWTLGSWLECSPMAQETWVQSQSSHTKDSKMLLEVSFLNTQHYKVQIKGKVEQSSERSSTLPYTLV